MIRRPPFWIVFGALMCGANAACVANALFRDSYTNPVLEAALVVVNLWGTYFWGKVVWKWIVAPLKETK